MRHSIHNNRGEMCRVKVEGHPPSRPWVSEVVPGTSEEECVYPRTGVPPLVSGREFYG